MTSVARVEATSSAGEVQASARSDAIQSNVLDAESSERMSERHYVHIVYFGVRGGE